jgi:hypothetical protein
MFGLEEVEVVPIEISEVKAVCENCDDSGKACSVCHAGNQVE